MSNTNDNIMFHRIECYKYNYLKVTEKGRNGAKAETVKDISNKVKDVFKKYLLAIMSNEETKVIKIMMMTIFKCFGFVYLVWFAFLSGFVH